MKLSDLRKLSVRKNVRIHFRLPNGMECVVNEHGVAQLPSLHSVPDFRLEEQLSGVAEFTLETPATTDKRKKGENFQIVTRETGWLAAASRSGGGGSNGQPGSLLTGKNGASAVPVAS